MSDALRNKVSSLLPALERRFGKVEPPVPLPPASSADAAAGATVASKNAQIVAGVVLGLHGPPVEGAEAAKRLMAHFVDWNEVRVSRPATLAAVLGRQPHAIERVALLQRFLEAYFLCQRNLNLEYLFTLKPAEARRFLRDLETFDREELAAVYLTGFNIPVFPPSEALRDTAEHIGLIKSSTTTLQMAKKFETALKEEMFYELYSYLYALAGDPEGLKSFSKRAMARH